MRAPAWVPPTRGRTALEHGHDLLERAGRRCREKGGRSVYRVCTAHRVYCLDRAVHEVRTGTAVHMDVNKPRRDVTASHINDQRVLRETIPQFAHEHDPAIAAFHLGIEQQAIGQYRGSVDKTDVAHETDFSGS